MTHFQIYPASICFISSFISVVTNLKLFLLSPFLSISSTSLYFQAVPSQAENRFLNRQGSRDRAENHYWPHLGSIATAMASQDNRIDCHGYQSVNAHSNWKPLKPAFPVFGDLYLFVERGSTAMRLHTPVTWSSISRWPTNNQDIANAGFYFCMLPTVCSFSLFCLAHTFWWSLQHMAVLLYCKQQLLRPHLGTEFLYTSCMAIRQITHAEPITAMLLYLGLKLSYPAVWCYVKGICPICLRKLRNPGLKCFIEAEDSLQECKCLSHYFISPNILQCLTWEGFVATATTDLENCVGKSLNIWMFSNCKMSISDSSFLNEEYYVLL